MKEFKGSNFLLLFALLIDFIYILPPTIKHLNAGGDTDIKLVLVITSAIIHLVLFTIILIYPFFCDMEAINWGEDFCTKSRVERYDPSYGYKYRFSIILLIAYLFYQPVKVLINWTNKYLTINLDKNED